MGSFIGPRCWTAFPVPLGLGNIFNLRSLSANAEGNPLSKSFFVEEMAGVAGRFMPFGGDPGRFCTRFHSRSRISRFKVMKADPT